MIAKKGDTKGSTKSEAKGAAKAEAKAEAKGAANALAYAAKKEPKAAPSAMVPSESETFALYMAGVRALDTQKKSRIPKTASSIEKAAPEARTSDLDAPARAEMRSLVTEGLRFETTDDGQRLEGRRVDVDPRELRRLRRGQYSVDGTLDLHGMGLAEAREAVTTFVRKRGADGDRVVAIIHGKGSHSPRGVAVLRGEIGAWLADGRAARHVMAFATAPDEHGGTGALLVLLAR